MPVAEFDSTVWQSLRKDRDGKISPNFSENVNLRTLDPEKAYHDAGQWYWFAVPELNRNSNLMSLNTGSVVLPKTCVQDIDTEED